MVRIGSCAEGSALSYVHSLLHRCTNLVQFAFQKIKMHTLGLVCQSQLGLVWQGSCGDGLGGNSKHGHHQPA